MDLPGWQKIYAELKDQGFEIIAVAQDSEGAEAADRFYARARAEFTSLFDVNHTVSSLYNMVNVPAGVWIDEQGMIVRPAEVAYSQAMSLMGREIGDDRYAEGLRDWVAHGDQSKYVMDADKLAERLHRGGDAGLADANFRLGAWFQAQGDRETASKHWKKAQKLSPDNWNYHRQDWSYSAFDASLRFMNKLRKLDKPYYEPLDFPEDD